VLSLIFLKYISEVTNQSQREDVRFEIPAEASWLSLMSGVEPTGKKINNILNKLEDSNPEMRGLFSDLDYERIHRVTGNKLMELLEGVDQIELHKIPHFPYLFDCLLDWTADTLGYRGGEFRTPKMLSDLVVQLASPEPGMTVCDPTCGSGGMLIAADTFVKEQSSDSNTVQLYGQEKNIRTWAICKMNLLIHGLDARIELGDTLREPQLIGNESLLRFDRVFSNPPMSLRDWGQEFAQHDVFGRYKYGIPPKSSGDFAFIQHVISTLSDAGKGVVVISRGPLVRSGPEQRIRERLIKEDIIESVIALPPNLLYGTAIQCAVLVLNKAKPKNRQRKVLFINATKRGIKERSQTYLDADDLEWIDRAYKSFTQSRGLVKVVGVNLIAGQNYNLDIERYLEDEETPVLVRFLDDACFSVAEAEISGNEFEQWIEGLPYPLASILWSYTSMMDAQQKTNSLFHFFEALSQFNTTLILSAITSNSEFYSSKFSGIITKDVFTTSSFGGWNLVGIRLASKIRKMMKTESTQQECISIFGGVDNRIVNLLSDAELGKILQEAAKLRNRWLGHSGAVTKAEYSRRLLSLEGLLVKTRMILEDEYSSMILILPDTGRYKGGLFYNIVKEVRGTRTPFREILLETISPLESDSLHIVAVGGNISIKLLPFLRIMHSPETERNTCYFYNRVEPEGVRWITYQFQEESELTLPDEDVEAALDLLLPSNTN
jgi:type I restriction enzyme M protein